jgi:hypothetical protein
MESILKIILFQKSDHLPLEDSHRSSEMMPSETRVRCLDELSGIPWTAMWYSTEFPTSRTGTLGVVSRGFVEDPAEVSAAYFCDVGKSEALVEHLGDCCLEEAAGQVRVGVVGALAGAARERVFVAPDAYVVHADCVYRRLDAVYVTLAASWQVLSRRLLRRRRRLLAWRALCRLGGAPSFPAFGDYRLCGCPGWYGKW